jgi:hypothetical protein
MRFFGVLAMASQSLSIMIALIPYVRETFRRHLSQKQAVILIEFDKLKRVNVFFFLSPMLELTLRSRHRIIKSIRTKFMQN